MSRGDPHYAKVDIDIVFGEKFSQLTASEQHTYLLGPWMLAVKYKLERLPACINCTRLTASRLLKGCRTVAKQLQRMHDVGLITKHSNGDITVHGVKACHARLRWNKNVDNFPVASPYNPRSFPNQGIVREYESTTGSIQQRSSQDSISLNISNPDSVDLKGQQKNGQSRKGYISGQDIQDRSWEICNGLGIEDTIKNMSTLADMFHTYPAAVVMSGYGKTRDKLEADKAGTSEVPLQGSPLAYMWGCLRKEA